MRFRSTLLMASLAAFAACADQIPPSAPDQAPAPLFATGDGQVEGRYIVVLVPEAPADLPDQLVATHGGRVIHRYRSALNGFSAELPAQALEAIRRNPNVEFVEADGIASIGESPQLLPDNDSQWGLDRIDQRDLPFDHAYAWQNEGAGVEAFILDTGIRYTHQEFGGRAVSGPDFVSNDGFSEDCHGHGTHVAGTVGGTTTGVAKGVTLFGLRVLGCTGSGSWSGIIAAVDWVTQRKQADPGRGMVGNMSLGGGLSLTLNNAVNNSVAAGVVWAVAAGNENTDACNRSPAGAASALTTGATTSTDSRASFSNFGSCVDVFAPGSSIRSSTFNGDNTYGSWSGTSMASPHVAGVAALVLGASPAAAATAVNDAVVNGSTQGKVVNAGTNSPNRLLYSLIAGDAVPVPPPPPPPPADPIVVRISSLTGASSRHGPRNWKAIATATVTTSSGELVSGATVSGTFSSVGSGSCITGSNGRCSITSAMISSGTSITFTVGNVTGTGLSWDSANSIKTVQISR